MLDLNRSVAGRSIFSTPELPSGIELLNESARQLWLPRPDLESEVHLLVAQRRGANETGPKRLRVAHRPASFELRPSSGCADNSTTSGMASRAMRLASVV